ncbi:hypothetical protein KVR01_012308 [Diaporthe batatas]|uniref:uncharacterized protein n=1 Tax=Diaporthe batatas TaxID=748121 RepID=UPI001D05B04D|nr:uncharacterized protein KVR01_012308 [Diaporthe batatas]KAG8158036.1 hypothetical protein KVR01_012308 [Diaporthe batatas]
MIPIPMNLDIEQVCGVSSNADAEAPEAEAKVSRQSQADKESKPKKRQRNGSPAKSNEDDEEDGGLLVEYPDPAPSAPTRGQDFGPAFPSAFRRFSELVRDYIPESYEDNDAEYDEEDNLGKEDFLGEEEFLGVDVDGDFVAELEKELEQELSGLDMEDAESEVSEDDGIDYNMEMKDEKPEAVIPLATVASVSHGRSNKSPRGSNTDSVSDCPLHGMSTTARLPPPISHTSVGTAAPVQERPKRSSIQSCPCNTESEPLNLSASPQEMHLEESDDLDHTDSGHQANESYPHPGSNATYTLGVDLRKRVYNRFSSGTRMWLVERLKASTRSIYEPSELETVADTMLVLALVKACFAQRYRQVEEHVGLILDNWQNQKTILDDLIMRMVGEDDDDREERDEFLSTDLLELLSL